MPQLDNIVGLINTALQKNPFTGQKYQHANWNGIADPQLTTSDNSIRPVIIDSDGEEHDLSIDDKYNLQFYHCIKSIDYNIAKGSDYGAPGTVIEETAQMEMIFYGSRKNIGLRPEDMIAGAVLWLPKEFLPTQVSSYGLGSCRIELGIVNVDSQKVFAQQYSGKEYFLKTSQFMVSIGYRIISTFNKTCYTIC